MLFFSGERGRGEGAYVRDGGLVCWKLRGDESRTIIHLMLSKPLTSGDQQMLKSPSAIREDAKHLVNKLKNGTIQTPQAIQILCSYIEDLSVHLDELQKGQVQHSREPNRDKGDNSLADK